MLKRFYLGGFLLFSTCMDWIAVINFVNSIRVDEF